MAIMSTPMDTNLHGSSGMRNNSENELILSSLTEPGSGLVIGERVITGNCQLNDKPKEPSEKLEELTKIVDNDQENKGGDTKGDKAGDNKYTGGEGDKSEINILEDKREAERNNQWSTKSRK